MKSSWKCVDVMNGFGSPGNPKCPLKQLVLHINSICFNLLCCPTGQQNNTWEQGNPHNLAKGSVFDRSDVTCPLIKLFVYLSVFPSVLLICEPVLFAGRGPCSGCVVAAERLLQQGSLGGSWQVEEGIKQRQQQQSQQQRKAPVWCHYRLITASLQEWLILHRVQTDLNVARWKRNV